jgi:putative (di)nucleoside polyphosphate hydrolase
MNDFEDLHDFKDLPYRPCVGVALINARGLVFIGRRRPRGPREASDSGFEWQMPQGGIDAGETPRAAALRELYEETNVSSVSFLAEAGEWLSYDLPEKLAAKRWKGRYRGQTQKWFALRFEGAEAEINVKNPAGGAHPAEFDDWRWAPLETLPGLVVSFKREVYRSVVETFADVARPLG